VIAFALKAVERRQRRTLIADGCALGRRGQRLCRGLLFRPIDILGDLIAEHLAVLSGRGRRVWSSMTTHSEVLVYASIRWRDWICGRRSLASAEPVDHRHISLPTL
jgi:hypothetical protein